MLADSERSSSQSTGSLGRQVHLPAESRRRLIDFVARELPRWRDSAERAPACSETALTSQLCEHLTSAAHLSSGWDFLQFRTETPDETEAGRRIDLSAKPCAATVFIGGRRHSHYEALLPIECKRLPTPTGKEREEHEYVFTRLSGTGGIQRFKAGAHGATHSIAAMIGYVQDRSLAHWHVTVDSWIDDCARTKMRGWTRKDRLTPLEEDRAAKLGRCGSAHKRGSGRGVIEIQHLWLAMN